MRNSNTKHGHHRMRHGGGRVGGGTPAGDDARTFGYLGPGRVQLPVNMMGFQQMADGRRLRTWTFGGGFNNDRSVPSPVIEGIEGQLMEVSLSSMMPHSIHFHGLDVDQRNDGVPSTSGYVGRGHGGGHGGGFGGSAFRGGGFGGRGFGGYGRGYYGYGRGYGYGGGYSGLGPLYGGYGDFDGCSPLYRDYVGGYY